MQLLKSAVFAVFVLIAVASAAQTQPGTTPAQLPSEWTVGSLPASPVAVFAHNGDLWVCGWDEMIAVSHDRGHTWQVQHWRKDGEILYALSFGSDRVVYAAGTLATVLKSIDGGAHWKLLPCRANTSLSSGMLQFGDELHGILGLPDSFQWTSDGGLHWTTKGLATLQRPATQPPHPIAAAVLDGQHAAVLFQKNPAVIESPESAERLVAATTDGGQTWKAVVLRGAKFGQLVTRRGEYWLYSYTNKPSLTITEHSVNGWSWEPGPTESHAYSGCTRQGCVIDDNGWVDLTGAEPRFWKNPNSLPPATWAVVGNVACGVNHGLRCSQMQPGAPPNPETATALPKAVPSGRSIVPPRCIKCADPSYPSRAGMQGGTVRMYIVIEPTGLPTDLSLVDTPSAALAKAALDCVRGWRFQPATRDGKPVAVSSEVVVNFRCCR